MSVAIIPDAAQWQDVMEALDLPFRAGPIDDFLEGEATEALIERLTARFDDEGDDASGKWAELRPATVAIRELAGFPGAHPINDRTGGMRRWLTSATGSTSSSGDGRALEWPNKGTSKQEEKLATAQEGARVPPTVPRPVLALSSVDMALITEALVDHVEDVWRSTAVIR